MPPSSSLVPHPSLCSPSFSQPVPLDLMVFIGVVSRDMVKGYLEECGYPYQWYTTKENGFSYPCQPLTAYKFPGRPGLHEPHPLHGRMLTGPAWCSPVQGTQLCFVGGCHSHVMHGRQDSTAPHTICSSSLSSPSSERFPEPWQEGYRCSIDGWTFKSRIVIWANYDDL